MSNKSIRQIKIREIITHNKVETQEELVEKLNDYNFNDSCSSELELTVIFPQTLFTISESNQFKL